MRRVAPIILSILIGALAVGGGMGFYLSKANADRDRLSQVAEDAKAKAEQAQLVGQRAIADANQKLAEASKRIETTQATLKKMQDERDLMAKAAPLAAPTPKAIKNWNTIADIALGVSLKQPSNSTTTQNDERSLALAVPATPGPNYSWFMAIPYEPTLEDELLNGVLTATSEVMLLQDGHLLMGTKGLSTIDDQEAYVLREISKGDPRLLIWARDPLKAKDSHNLLNALGTLDFAD